MENSGFFPTYYGRPQRRVREELWSSLKNLNLSMNSPWLVFGDFNSVLFSYELMGVVNGHRCCSTFCESIESCHLMDARLQGSPFTWRRSNLRERLDHVLVNQHWYNEFVEIGVVHLPMFNSDHCPLWFRSGNGLFHSFS